MRENNIPLYALESQQPLKNFDFVGTYDVENITAQPITIRRICDLLPYNGDFYKFTG